MFGNLSKNLVKAPHYFNLKYKNYNVLLYILFLHYFDY